MMMIISFFLFFCVCVDKKKTFQRLKEEINKTINELYNNKELYNQMKDVSVRKAITKFSYYKIAQKAIGIEPDKNKINRI